MPRTSRPYEIELGSRILAAFLHAPATRSSIQAATCCSRESVEAWIAALRAKGVMRICGWKSTDGSGPLTPVYHLQVPFAQEDVKR